MRVLTDRLAGDAPSDPLVLHGPAGVAARPGGRRLVIVGTLVVVVAFSISLVLARRTALWLDEAQTVSIARLPVPDLLSALRADGSPPLYYLLLHGWMKVFGTTDTAARSLSTVLAVAAVALVPLAGRRFGGRKAAGASAVVLASTPFVHRYATEARMYALVILLTVVWIVLLRKAVERPQRRVLAAVAIVTGLLLLTHYWCLFLVAATAAVVAVAWARAGPGPARTGHGRVVIAVALGFVLFLPWAPSFVFQLRHTGAPWGAPADLRIFEASLRGLAGDRGWVGLLGFLYAGLAAIGLWGQSVRRGRIELDMSGRPVAWPLALVVGGTLTLGMVVSHLTDSAFAPRYTAVVVVPFVLLAARGLANVEHRVALPVVVAVLVGAGLLQSFDAAGARRTQARGIAAALRSGVEPGDVVVFCPDQLAPAVARRVDLSDATVATFPPGSTASRVDWVDYLDRAAGTRPDTFAASVDRLASESTVWLVWSGTYRAVGRSCGGVFGTLHSLRPGGRRTVGESFSAFEHASLWRFPVSDLQRGVA